MPFKYTEYIKLHNLYVINIHSDYVCPDQTYNRTYAGGDRTEPSYPITVIARLKNAIIQTATVLKPILFLLAELKGTHFELTETLLESLKSQLWSKHINTSRPAKGNKFLSYYSKGS